MMMMLPGMKGKAVETILQTVLTGSQELLLLSNRYRLGLFQAQAMMTNLQQDQGQALQLMASQTPFRGCTHAQCLQPLF